LNGLSEIWIKKKIRGSFFLCVDITEPRGYPRIRSSSRVISRQSWRYQEVLAWQEASGTCCGKHYAVIQLDYASDPGFLLLRESYEKPYRARPTWARQPAWPHGRGLSRGKDVAPRRKGSALECESEGGRAAKG
jgi:hypothetical protein